MRGSLALERAARAWALLGGRDYVTPVDVEELFLSVVMHRIVFTPSFVATAREIGWAAAADRFREQCVEIAPRPGPSSSPMTTGPRRRAVTATFPLIPRRRVLGLPFGGLHSMRRGLGSDVAGSRPYQPGDDVDKIDWYASARLSLARGSEEFVVREHFADEAPRVVVLCDRRPSMSRLRRRMALAVEAGGDPARRHAHRRERDRRARACSATSTRPAATPTGTRRAARTRTALPELERGFGAPEDTLLRGLRHLVGAQA